MALRLPLDKDALMRIPGCGKRKYEEYGESFLNIIRRFCEESPDEAIASKQSLPASETPAKKEHGADNSAVETLKLLRQGKSIEVIAHERNFSPDTIIGHIGRLVKWGHEFSPDMFFSAERFAQIREWFRNVNDGDIASVVFMSRGRLGYGEAKLASFFIEKGNDEAE